MDFLRKVVQNAGQQMQYREEVSAQTIYPFMRYNDAPTAIVWLVQAFGFVEQAVYQAEDGSITLAQLRIGGDIVMVSSAQGPNPLGLRSTLELGAPTMGLYVRVENPDAHYTRAVAAGAHIVAEPATTGYGSREYAVRDLEGNLWCFGTFAPPVEE